MLKKELNNIIIVTLFGIAMAFLESVIVYYIRWIYYPDGFSFPLIRFLEAEILKVEIIREIFTLVMLATVAMLAAKSFHKRFAYFWLAFAVWDIFYYVWLKVILNWPSSFLTWDVLFLIPWAWASPVLAPIIASVTMIFLALSILSIKDKIKFTINVREWTFLILGGLLQLYTFIYDYGLLFITNRLDLVSTYVPAFYNWIVFAAGEILIILGIISWICRYKK